MARSPLQKLQQQPLSKI